MIGQTISHYKILEKLGEGGMGVVYKAQDTKLDRFVALKFLPPHLNASEADKARFVQEAKAASALNHPNVCTIHDIQEHDGQMFIVMEYVEGQTLQEKKSNISYKQAIDIGVQVADGLAAAHEKGIVHRDIKPENIMIRKDGIAQIMDFGLAKLQGVSRLTKEGSTVGTAGYMSPEQVQGQDADHRSDIFSFGVVLYELLTGGLPFKGIHETALAYEIVNVDPAPMSSVKPEIDATLDAIVLECLEKDPNERTQSAKQIAIDLKRFRRESSKSRLSRITAVRPIVKLEPQASPDEVAGRNFLKTRPGLLAVVAVSLLVIVVLAFVWHPWSANHQNFPGTVRLSVTLPQGMSVKETYVGSSIAISPDGKTIAFVAALDSEAIARIYVRTINDFNAKPIPGTEGGAAPVFSPDGKWLLFSSRQGRFEKVSLQGGAPTDVAPAANPRGFAWGDDGMIVFSPDQIGGLLSVSSSGGSPKVLTVLDSAGGEISQRFPDILPGGKTIVFTSKYKNTTLFDDAKIVVERLDTHERKNLIDGGTYARYIPTGQIVYVRSGSLYAVPFDVSNLQLTGPPSLLFKGGMMLEESGAANYCFSTNGVLAYLPGGPAPLSNNVLDWIYLDGAVKPLIETPGPYFGVAVAPDAKQLALMTYAANNDIWRYDLIRKTKQRLTFGGGNNSAPFWSLDGKRVVYTGEKNGNQNLFWKRADGSGKEEQLTTGLTFKVASSWTPDGKTLAYTQATSTGADIWMLPMEGDRKPYLFLQDQFLKNAPKFSPDGHWLAYASNESGTQEVYVVPFPKGQGKWQVSSGGGVGVHWTRDGRQLLYANPNTLELMSVSVATAPSVTLGSPKRLFAIPANFINGAFDVANQRFAIIRQETEHNADLARIDVVVGWFNEMAK
jgi:eukaryotic-like serine/threonine-protein kinase